MNETTDKIKSDITETELIELLEKTNVPYSVSNYNDCDIIYTAFRNGVAEKHIFTDTPISVLTYDKDVFTIYPHEILYITIDNRNSILYLTDGKIETPYPIRFWKNVLDENIFAQPHYSYIVNLMYISSVTKNKISIKYKEKEYTIYASSRKLPLFKEALLKFKPNR